MITRRKDGRWVATMTIEGKRKYLYGKTKEELEEKLRSMKRGMQTVRGFLQGWLQTVEQGCKPSTYGSYEYIVRCHLIPHIGEMQLTRLTARDVQHLIYTKPTMSAQVAFVIAVCGGGRDRTSADRRTQRLRCAREVTL